MHSDRSENRPSISILLTGMAAFLSVLSVFAATIGCATDNEFLLKCTLIPRRSDKIPQLMRPWERTDLIREKGKRGATAPQTERDILVSQLLTEYRTSPDPNLRRETVDAIAKIPHPMRIDALKEAIKDEDDAVRAAAVEGIANPNLSTAANQAEIAHVLRNVIAQDTDTYVRITAIQMLGQMPSPNRHQFQDGGRVDDVNFFALGAALSDKSIAVQHETMKALAKYTGRDYGTDATKWNDYYNFAKGNSNAVPAERTISEKIPTLQMRMFR